MRRMKMAVSEIPVRGEWQRISDTEVHGFYTINLEAQIGKHCIGTLTFQELGNAEIGIVSQISDYKGVMEISRVLPTTFCFEHEPDQVYELKKTTHGHLRIRLVKGEECTIKCIVFSGSSGSPSGSPRQSAYVSFSKIQNNHWHLIPGNESFQTFSSVDANNIKTNQGQAIIQLAGTYSFNWTIAEINGPHRIGLMINSKFDEKTVLKCNPQGPTHLSGTINLKIDDVVELGNASECDITILKSCNNELAISYGLIRLPEM